MSFFGGYSKRGRQLEEQDRKFLEFQKQIKEEEIVFEKGDYPVSGMCNMPNGNGVIDKALGIAQQQIFLPLRFISK